MQKLLLRIELEGLLHLEENKLQELHTLKGSWVVQIKNQSDFSIQKTLHFLHAKRRKLIYLIM